MALATPQLAFQVPTQDRDVKSALRKYGEPISLFGEGPYERRERLHTILLKGEPLQTRQTTTPPTSYADIESIEVSKQPEGTFYSEGSAELLEARKFIARYSLPRAVKRLQRESFIQRRCDPLEMEDRSRSFISELKHSSEVASSQIGDERPLTVGKFSPDSNHFATGSWSNIVKIWNVPSCNLAHTLRGHNQRVHTLAWHPYAMSNNKSDYCRCQLVTGSADGVIMGWDLNNVTSPIHTFNGHDDRINNIAIHPSGKYMATTSYDETWRLWDMSTTQNLLIQEGNGMQPHALKLHPDGSLLVTGDLGGRVIVWDLRTGHHISTLTGHFKQVLSVDINPQAPHQIASASDDNTVRIWDLRKQACTNTLLAHNKIVSSCIYEPNYGRYLVTTSYDSQIKLWSTSEWSCFKALVGHEGRVMAGDISADGTMLGSVAFDRTWKLWKMVDKNYKQMIV